MDPRGFPAGSYHLFLTDKADPGYPAVATTSLSHTASTTTNPMTAAAITTTNTITAAAITSSLPLTAAAVTISPPQTPASLTASLPLTGAAVIAPLLSTAAAVASLTPDSCNSGRTDAGGHFTHTHNDNRQEGIQGADFRLRQDVQYMDKGFTDTDRGLQHATHFRLRTFPTLAGKEYSQERPTVVSSSYRLNHDLIYTTTTVLKDLEPRPSFSVDNGGSVSQFRHLVVDTLTCNKKDGIGINDNGGGLLLAEQFGKSLGETFVQTLPDDLRIQPGEQDHQPHQQFLVKDGVVVGTGGRGGENFPEFRVEGEVRNITTANTPRHEDILSQSGQATIGEFQSSSKVSSVFLDPKRSATLRTRTLHSAGAKLDQEFNDFDFDANLLVPECEIEDRGGTGRGGVVKGGVVVLAPVEGKERRVFGGKSSGIEERGSSKEGDRTEEVTGGQQKVNFKDPVWYSCSKCDFRANKMSQLKLHEQAIHDGFRFFCDRCDFKTTTKTNMKSHNIAKHGEEGYDCEICGYRTTSSSNLNRHKMAKHEKIRFPCSKCDYRATIAGDLKKHILSKHEGVRYPCGECDYQGTTVHNLNKHKMSRHQGVRFPCDLCDYKATTPKNLKTHTMAKHDKIRYPCEKCDYKATVVCDLKKHILTKHEGLRYPCDMCDYLGTTVHNLKKHKQSKHEGIRYPCDACGHKATDPINLKRHKLTKHSGERYPCESCDHRSTTMSDLKKHIISKHDGARFSCDQCDYIGTEWNLKKHKVTKHKPLLACLSCDFRTLDPQDLTQHINTVHKESLGFPCESCDHIASDVESWRKHSYTSHMAVPMENKFFCNKCDFKATNFADLKDHEDRGHCNEEDDFVCDHCNFKTHSQAFLESHLLRVHGEDTLNLINTFSCDQCDFSTSLHASLKKHRLSVHFGLKHYCDECNYESKSVQCIRMHKKKVHEIFYPSPLQLPLEPHNSALP